MFKKSLFTLVIIAITLSTGCTASFLPERTEIDKLNLVRAIGLDKGLKNPSNICVTIISKKPTKGNEGDPSGGGQKSKEKAVIFSNEAATIFEAEREFQEYSDKRMFFGHTDYYLIGEDAARESIAKYIDFLARDHEFRDNSKVYIIRGSTAKEFIEQSSTNDYFMPDRLNAIGENAHLFTGAQELELLEFMQGLNNKYSCAIAPAIFLNPKVSGHAQEEKNVMEINMNGYAVFKNLRLITLLDKAPSRGENFLLNRVVTGVIEVNDPSGNVLGLELISSKAKITPVIKNNKLESMSVKVRVTSNVDEVHSTLKIFNEDTLKFLASEQSSIVKKEIENVIGIAKENNTDFVDMANVFSTNHPVIWQKYKNKWDEIFPTLPINVEVESKINRTYDIREPNGYFEEEHK